MRRVILFAALAISCSGAIATPSFNLTELGDLPGGNDESYAYGINSHGQVVGLSSGAAGVQRPFLWSANQIQDLGALPGKTQYGFAQAINDLGHIVGFSEDEQFRAHAYLLHGGAMDDLGELPGGIEYSAALSINESDDVVGWSHGSDGFRAVVWRNEQIAVLPGLPDHHSQSIANDINNAGQITGTVDNQAYIWNNGIVTEFALNSGEWRSTNGYAINSSGMVVGGGETADGIRAFLWDGQITRNLSELAGGLNDSFAMGINDIGQIVGRSSSAAGRVATLWTEDGSLFDLNALIDPHDPLRDSFFLTEAWAINESGQIVGQGLYKPTGTVHAFLLSPVVPAPVPIPATWFLMLSSFLWLRLFRGPLPKLVGRSCF